MKNWLKAFLQAAGVIAATCGVWIGAFLLEWHGNLPGMTFLPYVVIYLPIIVTLLIIRQPDQLIRMIVAELLIWPVVLAGIVTYVVLFVHDGGIYVISAISLIIFDQMMPLILLLTGLLVYRRWVKKNPQTDV